MHVPRRALDDLENDVLAALETGDQSRLTVLGFGEVSTVLSIGCDDAELACKRLLPYRTEAEARRSAEVIERYVELLTERGVDVVASTVQVIRSKDDFVVYVVQPALDPGTLGPAYLRALPADETRAAIHRILEVLKGAVSPVLAPDGQLSNWAFVGDGLRYLDVTSPFLRDEAGNDVFDFEQVVRVLPRWLRYPVRKWGIKSTLDTYFSLRGQAIDLLGNLEKEGLGHLIGDLVPTANETLELDPPITEARVRAYYTNDARMYAFMQAASRSHCWVEHHVLRRPYPFLPKPRLQRFFAS